MKVFDSLRSMLKAGIIGLGKMGLSHQSVVNAHPELQLKSVCNTSGYLLDVLSKYTGVRTYTDYKKMLSGKELNCIFVATPSLYHAEVVQTTLEHILSWAIAAR
jgi:scyllo-inositol 2-dehydrogenase (NADP+)